MRTKTLLALAALLASFSGPLHALGLGDASVRSFLNEPLEVRLALIGVSDGQLDSLDASLASADDFELVGLSRAELTVPLQFEVVTGDGAPYVAVSSREPVGQPVLQMLVEVSWSGGRMLRQYTLFLDPPTVAAPPPPRPVSPPAAQRDTAAETSAPPTPRTMEPAPAADDSGPARPAPTGSLEHGPVRDGETLWGIASDWARGSGYTVNQMMLAIQRENPDAFIRENINLLKRGAILRLPTRERAADLSAAEARLEVARQNDGAGLAPTPTLEETPPALAQGAGAGDAQADAQADAQDEAATPSGAADTTDRAAAESAAADSLAADGDVAAAVAEEGAGGRLELVPPSEEELADAAASAGGVAQAVPSEAELARVEEELASSQQANEYLSERVRELEQQLEQTRGELTVADRELAQMEASLREQRAAQADDGAAFPWWLWLLGGVVVLAAGGGLLAWRRARGGEDDVVMVGDEAPTRVQGLREEAEELLGVLGEDAAEESGGRADASRNRDAADEATVTMRAVPDPEPRRREDDDSTVVVPHPALAGGRRTQPADDASDRDAPEDDEAWRTDDGDTVVTTQVPADFEDEEAIDEATAEEASKRGADDDDDYDWAPAWEDGDADGDEDEHEHEHVAAPQDTLDEPASDDEETGSGDAVEVDASDPEIKLDLARAYLSLGDREAARAMLEEVLAAGSDEQKAEAASMMEEL